MDTGRTCETQNAQKPEVRTRVRDSGAVRRQRFVFFMTLFTCPLLPTALFLCVHKPSSGWPKKRTIKDKKKGYFLQTDKLELSSPGTWDRVRDNLQAIIIRLLHLEGPGKKEMPSQNQMRASVSINGISTLTASSIKSNPHTASKISFLKGTLSFSRLKQSLVTFSIKTKRENSFIM